ncbi:subtilisin-like protease SBT4.15 [Amaranthus tricolor]|uniref:subtilisin-like protease SBT4.15 n=1 Tax=Amaranthus tricolor TaxID=29722 RepID=UPI00258CAAC3|nr:subtilisin-like protease SBT4.15 [Amaranthus tricolor]
MGLTSKARLVAYKVDWSLGSSDMDLLAAFKATIDDNVDIINLSGATKVQGFMDSFAIGSFRSMKNGILTIASAGNTGPALGIVVNVYPWVLTVAASTIDREFFSNFLLGKNITVRASQYFNLQVLDSKKFNPLITGMEARISGANINNVLHCQDGSLDASKVVRKIVVCGYNETVNVQVVTRSELFASVPRAVSTALISYNDGQTLFSYINSTRQADFSSRGPQPLYFNSSVSKPDVTALSVDTLAARKKENSFVLMSRAPMSSPHVQPKPKLTTNNHRISDNTFRRHLIAKRSKSRPGDGLATRSEVVAISFVANLKVDAFSSPFFQKHRATKLRPEARRHVGDQHSPSRLVAFRRPTFRSCFVAMLASTFS